MIIEASGEQQQQQQPPFRFSRAHTHRLLSLPGDDKKSMRVPLSLADSSRGALFKLLFSGSQHQ
jgi:hypothetical protein